MEELYWADIKTNLTGVYFDDRTDDSKFVQWLDSEIDSSDFAYNSLTFDCPVEGVTSVTTVVQSFTDDHTLDVAIQVESDYDYTELWDNEELRAFVQDSVIPQFIDEFNARCSISFPMTRSGNFDWMKFNGDEFFAKVYYSETHNSYMNVSVASQTLYLINDFKLNL